MSTTADERDLVMVNVDALDALIDQADNALAAMPAEVPEPPAVPELKGTWDRSENVPNAIYYQPVLWEREAGNWHPVGIADEADALNDEWCKFYVPGHFSETLNTAWEADLDSYIAARAEWLAAFADVDFGAMSDGLSASTVRRLAGAFDLDRSVWKPGRRRSDYSPALADAASVLNDIAVALGGGVTFEHGGIFLVEYFNQIVTVSPFGCSTTSTSMRQVKKRPETIHGPQDAEEQWDDFKARVASGSNGINAAALKIAALPDALRRLRASIYIFRRGSQYRFRGE